MMNFSFKVSPSFNTTMSGIVGVVCFTTIFFVSPVWAIVLGGFAYFNLWFFLNSIGKGRMRPVKLKVPLGGGEEIVIEDVDDDAEVRLKLDMVEDNILEVIIRSVDYLKGNDPDFEVGCVERVARELLAERENDENRSE